MIRVLLAVLALTLPAQAEPTAGPTVEPTAGPPEEIIGEAAFEALSQGNTLHFSQLGLPYGREQFSSDRTSIWQFADGTCTHGSWFSEGDQICFVYEHYSLPQCWFFSRRDGQYYARLAARPAPDPSELRLDRVDQSQLDCPAPDLGM